MYFQGGTQNFFIDLFIFVAKPLNAVNRRQLLCISMHYYLYSKNRLDLVILAHFHLETKWLKLFKLSERTIFRDGWWRLLIKYSIIISGESRKEGKNTFNPNSIGVCGIRSATIIKNRAIITLFKKKKIPCWYCLSHKKLKFQLKIELWPIWRSKQRHGVICLPSPQYYYKVFYPINY